MVEALDLQAGPNTGPLCAFWLGQAWGLSREASWAVGVCYGFSGFFISQLTFYNLIAGAALAPALVAACLRTPHWRPSRPRPAVLGR